MKWLQIEQKENVLRNAALLVSISSMLLLGSNGVAQAPRAADVVGFVQPLAGTGASTTPAALRHGSGTEQYANTVPAVGRPFGMTQWTPQTQTSERKCVPPYRYSDARLYGFRGSHWLSGSCTQDYGSFAVMPVVGPLKTRPDDYALPFAHRNEISRPHYYALNLPAQHLKVELTGTARCGMLQFTLTQADSLYLLVLPNSDRGQGQVQVDARAGEISGYNPAYRIYQGAGTAAGFSGYFVARVEKTGGRTGTFAGGRATAALSVRKQAGSGAFVGFRLQAGERLRLRIGTSFSSLEGARGNLVAEMPGWNFDDVVAQGQAAWQRALGQIAVTTPVAKNRRVFYTALYHAFQQPRLYNDADGTYPPFAGAGAPQVLRKGSYYDDFSMWDTYRAQLPLLEILQPERVNDLVRSLVLKGQQGGWLPIFPCWNSYTAAMIGDHGTAFIASAYAKGIRDYDVAEAYRLMRQNAFEVAPDAPYRNGQGRRALASYLHYGYVPLEDSVPEAFHKKEQVSRTLEYAFDDYALATVARSLGKTADAKALQSRARSYHYVFDPTVGLMRGRHADGRWYQPFRPDAKEPYITEGTPRQYSFYVPQDVPGLATLLGGRAKLETALDTLFGGGEYWHGNEPGHQIPFLYNYTSAPWKTQRAVRRILAEEYSDGPGGLSGNDDAGQMSAWYVFAALGFYPVNPVSGEYLLCAPIFDEVTLRLPGGRVLHIATHKSGPTAQYISRITWNGRPYAKNYLRHSMLMQGGRLEIELAARPNQRWAITPLDQPIGLRE